MEGAKSYFLQWVASDSEKNKVIEDSEVTSWQWRVFSHNTITEALDCIGGISETSAKHKF